MIERYYHYCCQHSANKIGARGFLQPNAADLFGVGLVWLTDQAVPNREALGLTSHTLKCDRLEYQYLVDVVPGDVEPWLDSAIRARLIQRNGDTFRDFEDGRDPRTWFIARHRVYAIRNRRYRAVPWRNV